MSTLSPAPRSSRDTCRVGTLISRLRRAAVAGHVAKPAVELVLEQQRVARLAAVKAPDRGGASPCAATMRLIASAGTRGWSLSVTTTASASSTRARPQASEADWPSSPALAQHRLGAVKVDSALDLVGRGTEDYQHPVEARCAMASRGCSSMGRPSSSASCFPPPKRVLAPAASTIPAST